MRLRDNVVVIFLLMGSTASAQSQLLYPLVSKEAQSLRDDDRRLILQSELRAESDALTRAQGALGAEGSAQGASAVHRHSENIKALQRELSRVSQPETKREVPRIVVKATRPVPNPDSTYAKSSASFWNPYNRTSEDPDFFVNQRKEIP